MSEAARGLGVLVEVGFSLYARYLCSRDALGLKAAAGRPSAARDDRVSCIQGFSLIPVNQGV